MQKREIIWLDFFAAGSLFAAFWVVALRLDATGWSDELTRIKFFVLFGFSVGYLLGLSRFERRGRIIISSLYTITLIPWVLGTSMASEIAWGERLVGLWGRLTVSFELFVTNQPVDDYILYVLSMAILFWFMSLLGGFQLSRKGAPWIPLMVAGLLFVSIETSSYEVLHRSRYSGGFILFALLSLGRIYFLGERGRWSRTGIAVDSEAGYDLGRSMAVIGLVLVLIAWNVPSISNLMTTGKGNRFEFSRLKDRLSNLTAGLDMAGYTTSDFSYGNDLSLGTGVPLEEVELFQVQASRRHPTGIPFYWKSQSYDYYIDGQWKNTVTREHEIEPSDWPIRDLGSDNRVEINLTYTIRAASIQTLYSPEMPQQVSRPALWVGDSAQEGQVDLIAVKVQDALRSGETIKVETRLKELTVAMLRGAAEEYPKWVTDRYLNLPEDFSQSVADLADELTKDEDTQYDKTRAITSYLRNEIEYVNEISEVPEEEDLVEWFLFTNKAGFCNYYATAEVLMLRSLGIPARMVVGFAEGTEDEEKQNLYHVYMNDYHAWPEVYFPQIGWVQFEPTASQPNHSLRLGLAEELSEEIGNEADAVSIDRERPDYDPFEDLEEDPGWNLDGEAAVISRGIHPAWIVFSVILVMAAAIYVWWRNPPGKFRPVMTLPEILEKQIKRRGFQVPDWIRNWSKYTQLSPVERMFRRVPLMLRVFGESSNHGDTVAEQIAVLSSHLQDQETIAKAIAFQMAYEKTSFSLTPVDLREVRQKYYVLWWGVLKTIVNRWRGV